MERSLERYYTKFEQPPFAPTYYPSEEEFADPIGYVARIRPEAERYGVVKIVPPPSFKPSFVIDPEQFEFTPRVQRLNEIDALFRLRVIFINRLVSFWHLQGQQFRLPWVENRYIDLYRLRQLINEGGGVEKINEEKQWANLAKQLGFKPAGAAHIKQAYVRWVVPFEKAVGSEWDGRQNAEGGGGDNSSGNQPSCSQTQPTSGSQGSTGGRMGGMRGGGGMAGMMRTRAASRMMAGLAPTSGIATNATTAGPLLDQRAIGKRRRATQQASEYRMELMMCMVCRKGNNEARLLLCEVCDKAHHTYCLDPPLASVPKGEWRCAKCVSEEVKKAKYEFGFHDSQQRFTLSEFNAFADEFKRDYFGRGAGKTLGEVPQEKVEAEFWANAISFDNTVAVKYGADLITSKVGSGFPRKTDSYKGTDARERLHYANHPWNLNNLPVLKESVLSHIDTGISGMMVPWVYVGMCFSTFCWHVEDHWTYSINYNHKGERKIWYGIAGNEAEHFDELVKQKTPELFHEQPDLLHHMTTTLNPRFLIECGLPVHTVHQNAGEYVVTFPRAYHAGFNEGFNVAEAVNFAPPDWLHMGRLCLSNYQAVGRTCVFAHEELVMRMVEVAERMSMGMCLAALEELRHILARETEVRKQLTSKGCKKSEFCKFEDFEDDARTCCVCRTTLFMSALVCRHDGRIVCMNHIDRLCESCRMNECKLRYRYTLEDLIPLVRKLTKRTTSYEEWLVRVSELFGAPVTANGKERSRRNLTVQGKNGKCAKKKIDVYQLKELESTWRTHRYPQCGEIRQVQEAIAEFEKTAAPIYKIVNRKIRLRDNTRQQKADTRHDVTDLEVLRNELAKSHLFDSSLEKELEELSSKVRDWRRRLAEVMSKSQVVKRNADLASLVEQLRGLHEEAEEFSLRIEPETEALKSELARCSWLNRAGTLLERIEGHPSKSSRYSNGSCSRQNKAGTSKAVDGERREGGRRNSENSGVSQPPVDIGSLVKLIGEAGRWLDTCGVVRDTANRLAHHRDEVTRSDSRAETYLQASRKGGPGFTAARDYWVREGLNGVSDCLHATNLDTFREELTTAEEIHDLYAKFTASGSRPQKAHSFYFRSLEQLENQCENSLFERNSTTHNAITALKGKLAQFLDRISKLFLEGDSYYSVFEMLAGRDDLPTLVEGEPLPLALQSFTKSGSQWNELKYFDTTELLTNHLAAVREQQSSLLMALRAANSKRTVKETCSCGNGGKSGGAGVIACFVCAASFHAGCARWDPFLSGVPEGLYLCQRCLRSKRPVMREVEEACKQAPANSLELITVKHFLEVATTSFNRFRQEVQTLGQGRRDQLDGTQKIELEKLLVTVLSLELTDTDTYHAAFSSPHIRPLLPNNEGQIAIWRSLKASRLAVAPAPRLLFSAPSTINGGGSNGASNGELKHVKKGNSRRQSAKIAQPPDSSRMDSSQEGKSIIPKATQQSKLGVNGRKRSFAKSDDHYHRDGDMCASEECLQPYSDQVRWIQCESGCERWFHYVCVGQTVKAARMIASYSCQQCHGHTSIGAATATAAT